MILEKRMVDLLQAAVPSSVYFGRQPQGSDREPALLPVVIVNRAGSTWLTTVCGSDLAASIVTMQVDYYAESAEGARRLADAGRAAIATTLTDAAGNKIVPGLDSEPSFYDDFSRAWRVMQTWRALDQTPSIP